MFVTRKLQALKATQLSQGYKAFSALAGLDAKTPKEKLTFGSTFSDHLLEVDWDKTSGWGAPLIRYTHRHPLLLHLRVVSCSPYGKPHVVSTWLDEVVQCFEGMKAYIDGKGKIRLFRPELNMKRMNSSMERLFLPAGTMNLFVYWINEQGEKELITAPLTRGDILPGVTRQSILELARGWGEFKVTETTITMPSIVKAEQEGRLLEVFGSGTAAVISPVKLINYNGKDVNVPLDAPDGKSGQLTKRIWNEMTDIQVKCEEIIRYKRSNHSNTENYSTQEVQHHLPHSFFAKAMATSVLHSVELLRCICIYQLGIHHDMIPFCQLKPRVESYTIYPSEFEEVDVLLTRWYAHHGIGRLNVLLQCMERMRLVVFVHAVLYGRQDVLDIIHDRLQFVHLDQNAEACGKPKLVYKWKDSFVLAAHHGHVQSLQYLHKNHFKRTSDTSVWFVAAANGHVGILKYLHDHDVEGWRHSIMEEAIKHGQLEVVRWIYDNKSDMQSLAVVNQALGVALEHRQLGVAKYLNQLWHAKMHR
ncbi:hypothetical protein DYB30_003400 [Aphanomyces astaci]|uniref:Uncharacterized protein n=2 Tax=Aphanomyces astaci TaxID=112090 RepID=A0A397DLM5_APHAT|nr:hypothetical protein DYB30_003400 [Aphanomyces astaci]